MTMEEPRGREGFPGAMMGMVPLPALPAAGVTGMALGWVIGFLIGLFVGMGLGETKGLYRGMGR